MMPHDLEIEANVLAGMLKYEKCLYEGIARFKDDHFYFAENQVIFATIIRLAQKGRPSFREVLVEVKELGLTQNLLEIHKALISEDQFPIWADKLHDFYVRRQYMEAAQSILESVQNKEANLESIADMVEQKILSVHKEESETDIIDPAVAAEETFQEHEERLQSDEEVYGIKLSKTSFINGQRIVDGFPTIDKTMLGLKGGDLVVIAAQSGEGKTAMAQNIVRHASIYQDYYTYYENTEMDRKEMVYRFVAQLSGVEFEKIYRADYNNQKELDRVRKAFDIFKKSNVYLSQLPMLTPQRSRGLARKFKLKYGRLDLLVIDYIGRMEVLEKGLREDQVLAMVARESKRLAQELNCVVILLAQLTEEGKIEGARRIKNDADAVFFIERLTVDEKNHAPYSATHKLTKFKVRRGGTDGITYLNFNKPKMYITEVVK